MEQIIDRLFVGNDSDYERVKGKDGWSALRCCKEGPGGHRDTLGYTTMGAPKGPHYLSVSGLKHLALNFIDPKDPNYIPLEMVQKGLSFIDKRLAAGDKVLVACNAGHSRGPTTAMLYLRAIGELDNNFFFSERIFRTLYPNYLPDQGVRQFARTRWNEFHNALRKDQKDQKDQKGQQ
jgi:hypothetical protein